MVRKILKDQYKNEPNGHCGNEDCGQMSSWYVFSSLGFYPVNPAQGIYILGSPLFDSATIQLENGEKFTIKTINNSATNIYVQSVTLNGNEVAENYITHQEIQKGGILVFTMGKEPNTNHKNNLAISNKVYN